LASMTSRFLSHIRRIFFFSSDRRMCLIYRFSLPPPLTDCLGA
jgi:hypothetical protein